MGGGGARAARRIQIRRPRVSDPGVARRVRLHSDFCRLQTSSPDPALPADPCKSCMEFSQTPSSDPKCRIFGRFLAGRKSIKNHRKSRRSKILPKSGKSRLRVPKGPDFTDFGVFLEVKKHAKTGPAETSYFEGSINRNPCFHPSGRVIFASFFKQNRMFLPERLPDAVFSGFFRNRTGKVTFRGPPPGPAGSQWATKSGPTAPKRRKNHNQRTDRRGAASRDPSRDATLADLGGVWDGI